MQLTCPNTDTHTRILIDTRNLTPQRHKDGEEDGGRIVEEVGSSGGATGGAKVPEVTGSVTQRTHGEIETLVTHLQTEEGVNRDLSCRAPRCDNTITMPLQTRT